MDADPEAGIKNLSCSDPLYQEVGLLAVGEKLYRSYRVSSIAGDGGGLGSRAAV